MIMEPRISLLTLGVEDLAHSLRFYRDGLGWPTTWDGSRGVVFFQSQGTCLSLYSLADMARDVWDAAPPPRSAFAGIMLAHNVREKHEVDEVLALAAAAGATIVKHGQDMFWGGYAGCFADPDGHLWEVAWGAFPFRADGSLEIP